MPWGGTSDRHEQRRRGDALTEALAGKRAREDGRGSRGGAPIWAMREAWMTIRFKGSACNACGSNRHASSGHDSAADPDGFAVFGRYPRGFLDHVLKLRLLGEVAPHEVLHVCSGTLSATERWTVDIRPEARPRVVADGASLPFAAASFRAVMLDPPYTDQHARRLYGVENPRPSWLLREAARVVVPGGRIGLLHVAIPFAPPGCRLVNYWDGSTGVGFRVRAFTIYERHQAGLL